ncbi:hypothetical protein GQ43DRAFT_452106 [Delitschia confertaspora ATCC 74209]|uniref:catechol O-methyltransferase n=1 Tax=Delitschia confertaspora ATCC 74209 TaxID=1513339 RepID=A0A9P4MNB7_9PLEO|nr:hypothetical protein GQ43DRAFT_452106 [Delitschia confertaspora ATCC 74209]
MDSFDQTKAYAAQEEGTAFFDDGREIELLNYMYRCPKIVNKIRGKPSQVLALIDEFARTRKYLMNVGEDKGRIITQLIAKKKPQVMVELGGYVGYSTILFADAVRKAGGTRYFTLERSPEFAAIIMALVDLAGLLDVVKVVIGASDESIMRLYSTGELRHIDLLFLDHYKPAYVTDLKLCEELGLITVGSVLAADNVVSPGNPPYLEYVRNNFKARREKSIQSGVSVEHYEERFPQRNVTMYEKKFPAQNPNFASIGNPDLVYESELIKSFEPTGVPHVLLILLSIVCLPITILIVSTSLVIITIFDLISTPKGRRGTKPNTTTKTILVTGVSMTKGLTIARLFHQNTPHRIIGADTEPIPFAFSPARFSRSLDGFYKLDSPLESGKAQPYVMSLLRVIGKEKVDLWISCSSVVSAMEDAEVARLAEQQFGPQFKAVQFGPEFIRLLHQKDRFIGHVQKLGMLTPETHRCESGQEVELDLLLSQISQQQEKESKYFILKSINLDDCSRTNMTTRLLPSGPASPDTRSYIASLNISHQNPYLLQEYIRGYEYCTHSLVVRGKVQCFVACLSSDMLMHYEAIASSDPLSKAMLEFTETVVEDAGKSFTGHLSFDFLVKGEDVGKELKLYPIECNPRIHTAVVLFQDTKDLVARYVGVLQGEGYEAEEILTPRPGRRGQCYYWIGHDLVTLFTLPLLSILFGHRSVNSGFEDTRTFFGHLLTWKDGTFQFWDPVPFLMLYHVYWPMLFLESLRKGKEWTRINVSTTKVFLRGK